MPPQIAVLGWGSLLWEVRHEFDAQHDDWRFDGPSLKLEFSRVSKTRLGALTLVIDPINGADCTVAWCISRRNGVEDAVADLRCREGTTLGNTGRLLTSQSENRSPDSDTEKEILRWASARGLDAVVWTALTSNFADKVKSPFSIDEALDYLKRLSPAAKVKAAEYIWRAPEFIRTPVRTAVTQATWFHA